MNPTHNVKNLRVLVMIMSMQIVITSTSYAQVYEKVFSFTDAYRTEDGPAANRGELPNTSLVQGNDGNFYGTTAQGGASGYGTIFKMTSNGVLTTLVEFSDIGQSNKGRIPSSSLIQGNDGSFYGTTASGGSGGDGTIFKMTSGGVLTTLIEFDRNSTAINHGSGPAGIVQGSDGNFYGVTSGMFTSGFGTIFKMTPVGGLTTLIEFTDNGLSNKGSAPAAALVQGVDGNFYGSTTKGGANSLGTIFKMTPAGVLTTLVNFTGNGPSNRGATPLGALTQGADGNFYGTTQVGGSYSHGTVFKMSPAGGLTTLVDFSGAGGSNRGSEPHASLVEGLDGNFYGTTYFGGLYAVGTVFMVTPTGVITILVDGGSSGSGYYLEAGLVQGNDGKLYGTTDWGGAYTSGTVFRMTPAGNLITLVNFNSRGASLGLGPTAELIQGTGTDGNLYGTTEVGGSKRGGTIFTMTPGGTPKSLVEFDSTSTANGYSPVAGLLQGSDGNFYGVTRYGGVPYYGGTFYGGTVFRVTPNGVLTTLVRLTGNGATNRGSEPLAPLIKGSDGNLYGTTSKGGASNNGTVFRMTLTGVLTTLVEFTGNGATQTGSIPMGGLVLGIDDNIYGTTQRGGLYGYGTVFKMTQLGVITTLVNFNNTGSQGYDPRATLVQASNGDFFGTTYYGGGGGGTVFKMTPAGVLTSLVNFGATGFLSQAGLVMGPDGNFYGTTTAGGAGNGGNVFKMTQAGVLTSVAEFSRAEDWSANARLVLTSDGNLYGTNSRPDGSIFRLLFPGKPLLADVDVTVEGANSALVPAKVNARGQSTTVVLDYGNSPSELVQSIVVGVNLTGFSTRSVGSTLGNLSPGAVYYYRFRAVSNAGTTVTPIASFSTLAEPVVAIGAPSDVAPTSGRFNATVNARLYNTTAVFEWGTDENSFPNTVAATPGLVTGNTAVPVTVPIAGLVKGTTYYYRVAATNAAGIAVSGSRNFTTLTDPTAAVSPPTAITSQSVVLNGFVNAHGANTAVIFEYGTNGSTFPFSVGATPSIVGGELNTAVRANLSGLTQGATYYYRVKATSAGGVGVSSSVPLSLDILSGFNHPFPSAPPEAQGFVLVTLTPSGVGGWRFTGEQQWRASGVPAGDLATGDRSIEFRPVPGYIQPPLETVGVVSGAAATFIERVYYETPTSGSGGLSVSLKPAALAAASVPQADRAQWRLLGQDDTQWRDSDAALTGLLPGNYLVECKPVAGRTTPPTSAALVQDFQTAVPTLTYFLADAVTGTPPSPIPFETVSTDTNKPYAHVGQIRSNVGSSSGFVVKQRVVATAGHVVFDDGTLSAVTGLQWLFQRHRGTYEPKPQIPRGYYIFDGYSAQRAVESTPGSSLPLSQNLDVAALYFLEDAGRAGYGGFLASDATDNEFLLSAAQKMLVGYPVDGISPTNQGRMHATPAANVAFTRAYGRTFTTPDIRSSGGMSGGPLCVQFESGNYYPAAIYLGGTGQTVVRSIDSPVIDLFTRAETSGNGGANNTGGGITHTGISTFGTTSDPGSIKVTILPAAASAGRWGLRSESSNRLSGSTSSGRSAGDYILQLTTISGFQTPTSPTVHITGGQLTDITFTYAADAPPPAISSTSSASGTRSQSLAYQIVASQSPTSYSLSGSLPTGLTFNTGTGLLNGTLQQAGVFIVTLGATNAGGTGTQALAITSKPAVSDQNGSVALGQPMNRQIASSESGANLGYAARNLPPGTSLDGATGLITGSPTQAGVFYSLFTVTKSGASESAILTLTVTVAPPSISSLASANGTRGQSLVYQIVASQSPASYSLTGSLPAGLTFSTVTGLISGTLQQAGVFIVTAGASNAGGSDSKTLTLTAMPAVSGQSASVLLGQPLSHQLASSESGVGVSYTANDLPPGTSLDEATGLITGSPSQAGVFNSLFTVSKGGASASAILTLTVTATALDVWRLANLQTTSNTGDAADSADPDKDGQTNLAEYAAGTNPNSAADVFKILTSAKNATTFTVTAAGKAARSYVLERRLTLTSGSWTTVDSNGPIPADGPLLLTDPASPPNSAFYRIRVSAP